MQRRALAIVNDPIAHLGSLGGVLRDAGFDIRLLDVRSDDFDLAPPADLVVVLGGEMGVYERDAFPFIYRELAYLRSRLDDGARTLGICLGAQLIAQALGSDVHPGPTMEIGFREIDIADAASPLRHFTGRRVMQWHRDTFALPDGARLLASSRAYPVEAFAVGDSVLATQFHPELEDPMYEEWIVDGLDSLAQHGVDADEVRRDAREHGPAMTAALRAAMTEWLAL